MTIYLCFVAETTPLMALGPDTDRMRLTPSSLFIVDMHTVVATGGLTFQSAPRKAGCSKRRPSERIEKCNKPRAQRQLNPRNLRGNRSCVCSVCLAVTLSVVNHSTTVPTAQQLLRVIAFWHTWHDDNNTSVSQLHIYPTILSHGRRRTEYWHRRRIMSA